VTDDVARVREDIKRTMTMREVVRIIGLPDPDRSGKIRSIRNPTEKTPSLHLYEYDWHDFSTGDHGDQIDLVQIALGVSHMKALEVLSRNATLTVKPRAMNEVPYVLSDYTARFQGALEGTAQHADDWEKIISEKWPTLTLVDLFKYDVKIIDTGALWIPHWVHDPAAHMVKVRGIKVRHLPDASKAAVPGSNFTSGLYRPDLGKAGRHAVVAEGESDAWVLAKMLEKRDVAVFALPSGASTLKDRFIDQLSFYRTVGLAMDDDEPGDKARTWFHQHLTVQLWDIHPPGGRVAEAAAEGWVI
jgi:hypothetical protein